uniref:Ferritin n=1 Tax=Nomascus leucogenys TaxID=61853 RepID=A0A2I3HUX8_NOMLE
MTTVSTSQVRQNYHQDSEAAINRQINLELYASYVYLSMSYYFDRDDVALKYFAKYFLHQSREEREHTEKLRKLQNQRDHPGQHGETSSLLKIQKLTGHGGMCL